MIEQPGEGADARTWSGVGSVRRWRYAVPAVLLVLREGRTNACGLRACLRDVFPRSVARPAPKAVNRLLQELQDAAIVTASSKPTVDGRRGTVYAMTDAGLEHLDRQLSQMFWELKGMTTLLHAYELSDAGSKPEHSAAECQRSQRGESSDV